MIEGVATDQDHARTARALRRLVNAITRLEYREASLSVEMFERSWELGIDAGPSVEDVLEWQGADLEALLNHATTELGNRPVAALYAGGIAGSTDDLPEFTPSAV